MFLHMIKSIEKIEHGYIEEYAENYSNKLLNKTCNTLKTPRNVVYKVMIENENQFRKP